MSKRTMRRSYTETKATEIATQQIQILNDELFRVKGRYMTLQTHNYFYKKFKETATAFLKREYKIVDN